MNARERVRFFFQHHLHLRECVLDRKYARIINRVKKLFLVAGSEVACEYMNHKAIKLLKRKKLRRGEIEFLGTVMGYCDDLHLFETSKQLALVIIQQTRSAVDWFQRMFYLGAVDILIVALYNLEEDIPRGVFDEFAKQVMAFADQARRIRVFDEWTGYFAGLLMKMGKFYRTLFNDETAALQVEELVSPEGGLVLPPARELTTFHLDHESYFQ